MRILVTGANGFIGSVVVDTLLRHGHEVVACCRHPHNLPSSARIHFRSIDLSRAHSVDDWRTHVEGVSAVVNCAGILRESREGDFERIHLDAPSVLVSACIEAGTAKFVQMSALGESADGRFIASKHTFDSHLLQSGLPATVLRPSVVLTTRGSYGGTSLLRSLAALPHVVFLPGNGEQKLQPVLAEDLAEIVLRCLEPSVAQGRILQVVGDEVLSLRETLALLRRWMRFPAPHWIRVPRFLVRFSTWVGDMSNAGPLGLTMGSMLERGNFGAPEDHAITTAATGYAARSIRTELESAASFVQDRWHARLYGLRPILWMLLVALWIGSGIAGLLATSGDYAPILNALGVPPTLQAEVTLSSSVLDLALGLALFLRWRPRLVLGFMLVSVMAYTLILGSLATGLWLDPIGGLIKNLAVIGLLLVCITTEDAR